MLLAFVPATAGRPALAEEKPIHDCLEGATMDMPESEPETPVPTAPPQS